MRQNNDPVRQENKKALPKFILIFVISIVVGLALGFTLSFLEFENFGEALEAFGRFYTTRLAGWLLYALLVLEFAAGLPLYFSAKKQLAAWDGEDEDVSNAIEKKLSVCIWITGMATILDFFFMVGHFAGMAHGGFLMRPGHVFLGLGVSMVVLVGTVIFQQKLVDATKRLNPEKHGSVYDPKFQKTWLESCDEAERAIIGQCAMKSYQAVAHTCLALWAVFAIGGMFFDWGFLPAMTVCVVWGVNQSVYSYWAIKLSYPGSSTPL